MRHPNPIISGERPDNYWIGGPNKFPTTVINKNADYRPYLEPFKLQKCAHGIDTYACLTCSMWNGVSAVHKLKYGTHLQRSWSFSAVSNGTVQGRGNNCDIVDEDARLNFAPHESKKPFTPLVTTIEEFFAKNDDALVAEAKKELADEYTLYHAWLGRGRPGVYWSTKEQIIEAAKLGAVRLIVDGEYARDERGRIIYGSGIAGTPGYVGPFIQYDHAVFFTYYEEGVGYHTQDSETGNDTIFVPEYKMGFCKVFTIEKKNMISPQVYKLIKFSTLFLLDPVSMHLAPIEDGAVEGGEVFKTLYNVTSYRDIPRVKDPKTGLDWEKLPYPVAEWSTTSKKFDNSMFQGYF